MGDEPVDIEVGPAGPLIGRLVDDRYRVLEPIAVGGMARVFLAEDERLERRVALKIIDDRHAGDPRFAAGFAREAKTVARLSHPNVVAVFDQGCHDGLPYVVMEYVAGRTLRDVLNARRRLPVAEALRITDQVLAGLAAAHRCGLVHRDVKPENILITGDGDELTVKVADFGLAHAVQAGSDATGEGPLLATVAYVPPELLTGGRVTARADVYSAGVVLFEMVTGRVPFDGPDPDAVAAMHVERVVPAAGSLRPGLPADLDALILRCTRRDPAARPPDALSFGRALRGVRGRPVGAARRVSPPTRVVRPPRQRRASWRSGDTAGRGLFGQFVMVAVLLALVGAGGWWLADGRYTQAPSLLNRDAAEVEGIAAAYGMAVEFTAPRFSQSVPESRVLAQDPDPGERMPRDGVITVTVSRGPERHEVPGLRGLSLAEAERLLADLQLAAEVVERRWHDGHAEGEVIDSDPPGGRVVHPGTVVGLTVSRGPVPARVPDVTGTDEADALRAVRGEGLRPEVERRYSPTVPAGRVLGQSPPPGTGVALDTGVRLTVSRGPAPVPVPDVVGESVASALETLTEAGFEVVVRGDADGRVVRQDPEAGRSLPRGARVTIVAR
ncbi:serine/threonine-protein kinase [Stackebrandtia albiflava]|uniref:non-specific serine/threonine protein kinase n=1 Tax=Stackebrandtia albiflava TaxID=406432 RepID=A0A562VB33_9ACTN|nr:Stk1 family PASTA domain-containing Ser/Thr kinase [Stackebrandtia albiflava]TWJ15075.1 serine/threonine-protein kinase [Stackebrandtia albiflava]